VTAEDENDEPAITIAFNMSRPICRDVLEESIFNDATNFGEGQPRLIKAARLTGNGSVSLMREFQRIREASPFPVRVSSELVTQT
jgi:hypothetical protein